jgi:hypothetical protein
VLSGPEVIPIAPMITPMLELLCVRERSGFLRASQLAGESTVRRS